MLHPVNQPVREVFFPNGGVASVTAVMQNGAMVEIATVGMKACLGSMRSTASTCSAPKR